MRRRIEAGAAPLAVGLLAAFLAALLLPLQAATLAIDASAVPPPERSGLLTMGTAAGARSPRHGVLAATDRTLRLDGRALIPVMGEFHYSRYPRAGWAAQLAKMKAAGVTIVSSYVIWQHHEEVDGEFDWQGNRDLRHFVQLAQQQGLMVFLRPGPWVHAELRFGGLPDWVVDAMPTRGNDPQYLQHVQRYFEQVAQQLQGLLWQDGGPVMGLQIENEYNRVGPLQGEAHIARLKQLLLAQGLDVPLYTVTGWDHAVWPRGEVIPLFGSYVDEPWSASAGVLPPRTSYAFQFDVRNEQGLGAQAGNSRADHAARDADITPFLGAEYGAGLPQMYRRRPLVAPDDIAAMVVAKLGSGVNLLGWYMFQGGENPRGTPWRGESVASGGYNDVPHIGYDFQAPLAQTGQAQPVLQALRPLHLFLQAFGEQLAPMTVRAPQQQAASPRDLQTLRWAVRGDGQRGFLFVNNHVRQHAMPAHEDTRFAVQLQGQTLTLPTRGLRIEPGAAFIWPLKLALPGGVELLWATAQPLTRIADDQGELTVFAAAAGSAAPEFVFAAGTQAQGAERVVVDGRSVLQPPAGRIVEVSDGSGRRSRFVWLDAAQARQLQLVDLRGRRHLLLSAAQAFAADGAVELQQEDAEFVFGLYPPPPAPWRGSASLQPLPPEGLFTRWQARVPAVAFDMRAQPLRAPGRAAAVPRHGPKQTPSMPPPEAFAAAASWTLQGLERLAGPWPPQLAEVLLDMRWEGDVARLLDGSTMLDDSYWIGTPWRVALQRHADRLARPWTFSVLPLRADAGIHFEPGVQPRFEQGQVARLDGLRLSPVYRLRLQADPRPEPQFPTEPR